MNRQALEAIRLRDEMRQHWSAPAASSDARDRTPEQKAFDRGVMATAELCRRLTKDESLAYALLAMMTGGLLEEVPERGKV